MRTLEELYKQIELTADFSDIKITDPNTKGLFSTKPLHVAAIWGDCDAIQMLVDAGADINAKGEYGFTPLHDAANQCNKEAVKLLVKLGAKAIKNNDGDLPSECVIQDECEEIYTFLKYNDL